MIACFANREPSLALLVCDIVKGTILTTHTLPLVSPRKNLYLGTQFSSDSRRAVFWGDYATVLNLETGALIRPTLQSPSSDTALDPSGRFLVASRTARLVLQDLEASDDSLAETELPMPLNAPVICLDRAGRWLIAGTTEGAVYVVDLAKMKLIGAPIRHQDGNIERLQVNLQGDAVAAADSHGFARAWSLPDGIPLTPPLRLDEPIASLAWDNGGRRLAVATISGDITLWDLERQPAVPMLDASNTHALPAPDGNQMFCWGASAGASVWDLTTDPPRRTANLPQLSVVAADWNAAGTKLAIASTVITDGNKSIEFRIWDPQQPQADLITTQQSYDLHSGDMFTRFIDEDTKLVVRAPTGPAVVDVKQGNEAFRFELTPNVSFAQFCFAVSNRIVAACERMTSPTTENRLRIWGSTGRLEFETRLPSARRVFSLRFSPDSRLLAVEGEFGVRLWRCRESDWEPVDVPKADQSVAFIDFDRMSTLLAYVDDSSMCHVVRLADASLPTTSFYVPGVPMHANFSPDGRRLALVTNHHGVSIWDWSRGEPLTPNYRQDGMVRQVLFAPDGNHLVLAGRNSGLEWWSIPAAKTTPWKELRRQVQRVTGLTWSSDRSVRRLTAAEWKHLAESPASQGSTGQ
jgi:WD40 repeat protein